MLSTLVLFEWGGFGDAEYELGGRSMKISRKGPGRAQDPPFPLPLTIYKEKQKGNQLGELRMLPTPFPLPFIKKSNKEIT